MNIVFTLKGKHEEWLLDLYALTQEASSGPRFTGPSDLARSLLEAVLDDDARDHASDRADGWPNGQLLH